MNQKDQAIAAYEKLVTGYPDTEVLGHALFELGNLLYDAKRFKEAIPRYEAAAARTVKELQPKVYYKLGLAYLEEKVPGKAADAFSKLVAEFPQSSLAPEGQYRLGRALQLQGKRAAAIQAFQKAIAAKPGKELTELAMFYTAECYRDEGNWAKGITAYKSAIARFPQSPLIQQMRYGKGVCAQHLGAYRDAVEAYKAVISGPGTETAARAQFGLAECSMLQGRYQEAIKEFLRIEILYGFDEWRAAGVYMAGKCAEKMKDKDRARTYYQKVLDNEKYRTTPYEAKARAALKGL